MRLLWPNQAVHVTAARLRIGMNVKEHVRAAARDGGRYKGNIYKSQNLLIHTCVIDKITLFPVIDIPAYRIFLS